MKRLSDETFLKRVALVCTALCWGAVLGWIIQWNIPQVVVGLLWAGIWTMCSAVCRWPSGWRFKFTIEGQNGTPYMHRYYLLKNRWFMVCIHNMIRDDEDDYHDHPWDFTSIILSGGYYEHTPRKMTCADKQGDKVYLEIKTAHDIKLFKRWDVIRHKAEDAHKLRLTHKSPELDVVYPTFQKIPAWTLVFMGPKRREWGFHTNFGWMPWEKYMDVKFGKGKWISEKEKQIMS